MPSGDNYTSGEEQAVYSQYKGQPVKSISSKFNMDVNDVVSDYDWTYSMNRSLRNEVPRITITEFKIIGNSYISSLISSSLVLKQGIEDINTIGGLGNITNKLKEVSTDFGNFMSSTATKTLGSTVGGIVQSGVNAVGDFASSLGKKVEDFGNTARKTFEGLDNTAAGWSAYTPNEELKQNYQFMYLREPTNRKYVFPYFNDDFYRQQNAFSDTVDPKGYLQGASAKISEYIEKAALAFNPSTLTQPGTYVERPKFYGFNSDGKEFTIEFYLYNTIRENEYVRNMELLTKLITQNTPHRVDRIAVDPPCIYEVYIPGRGFYPYAFISSLDIQHVGTRRQLNEQIVPDAFKVTIVLKSLILETNNITAIGMGTAGIDISKRFKYPNRSDEFVGPQLPSAPNVGSSDFIGPVRATGTEQNPTVTNTGGSVNVNGRQIMSNSGFLPSR